MPNQGLFYNSSMKQLSLIFDINVMFFSQLNMEKLSVVLESLWIYILYEHSIFIWIYGELIKWKSNVRKNKSLLGRHWCKYVFNLKLMKVEKSLCSRKHDVAFGIDSILCLCCFQDIKISLGILHCTRYI